MDLLKIKKGIRRWAAIYLGAVSCILIPLFMRHGYYSLIYWKSRAYLYAAIPAVAVVAVVEAADLLSELTLRSNNDGNSRVVHGIAHDHCPGSEYDHCFTIF